MYSFSPTSGCVGMGISALLCPRVYNVVKTVLFLINRIVDIPIDRRIVMSNFKIVNTIYFIDVTSQYFVYTIFT